MTGRIVVLPAASPNGGGDYDLAAHLTPETDR
jgi:hypothetical protein